MLYCKNCGEKNAEASEFCTHCGSSLQKESQNSSSDSVPARTSNAKNGLSKKQKILFSIVGIIFILFIGAHLFLKQLYSPMKQIQTMNQAYNSKDQDAFFEKFHVQDGVIADSKNFYHTVQEYGWTYLRDELTYEVEKLQKNENTNIIHNDGSEWISINAKPIFLGLYKKVEFTIIPMEVSIYAPFKNMTIQFGDQEVVSEAEDVQISLGRFIAGQYDWSYEYDEGLFPLTSKGSYYLSPSSYSPTVVELDWDFTTVYFESDVEDATLFVNGKDTGTKISELWSYYPVQLNEDIEVYAEAKDADGNTVTSEAVPLDYDTVYLSFPHIQLEQEIAYHEDQLKYLYNNFRSDYENAIYYINFNYIEEYFKEGSTIRKDYAKFVNDHNNISGYYYDFLLNDITDFTALSETTFELTTFETFDYSSDEDDMLHYERKKKYHISYEDGHYFINKIEDLDTKKVKY